MQASPARTRTPREIALNKPLPDRVGWDLLGPEFFQAWGYPRGEFTPEHIGIYGPTGRGKSYFERYILRERARLRGSRIIVVGTKGADRTLSEFGWPIIEEWPPPARWRDRKANFDQVVFWARTHQLGDEGLDQQGHAVRHLLDQLWVPDANTILAFDEMAYLCEELNRPPYRLRSVVSRYLREGRSHGITVVASTQRPAGVVRTMHSETSWSVFFAPKDEEDAERLAQVAGNKLYYRRVLTELNPVKFEFLLVHNLTGESYISSLPKKPIRITIKNPIREVPKKRQNVS